MPKVNEDTAPGPTPPGAFAGVLSAGVGLISGEQRVTFRRYVRLILPLDGYAFWVRADIVAPGALLSGSPFADSLFNSNVRLAGPTTATPPVNSLSVAGSLHYVTDNQQNEAEGFSTNNILFTAKEEVEALTAVSPRELLIGEFDGLQFAFSHRSALYRQADLFHYSGFAVYPTMKTQIIDSVAEIDVRSVIVSNSLPVWLTLNAFMPMWPSFLVDDNIRPPYCAVHIPPESTKALQAAPYIDENGSHWQLTQDTVRLTMYGLNNQQALAFLDYINAYSLNDGALGIMNSPLPRDEKSTQAELNILAQKKTMEIDVSYYQAQVRSIALKHIRSAFITIIPQQ